ncbi:hypothetical protein M8C13_43380 [Crossiella sp. SN42]|uniref:hypothetical protein n=1 Tax=Crossiella sp. SN42 TaxID=2944808 RepID=UPI00207D1693|nr:hypothetical protein [Crossiella sp. SN42]MCO1582608.1 hypothetical protein [Crossiella sp. SN42]
MSLGERIELVAVDESGDISPLSIWLPDSGTERILVELPDGERAEFRGADLLECLMDLREHLESTGKLLACQGARVNVFPSGLLKQWSGGREAYVLQEDQPDAEKEVVDVFAPADPGDVGTLAEQYDFVKRFHGL